MVDTIAFVCSARFKIAAEPLKSRRFEIAKGIRVYYRGRRPDGAEDWFVECSLPRVLFGCNGRLIKNQLDLIRSLEKLREQMQEFMGELSPVEKWTLNRLDLVWNYALDPQTFITAHQSMMYPEIRGLPDLYRGGEEGVSWRGAKSRLKITLYDKAREMKVDGVCLRGEVSLRKGQIQRCFKAGEWLKFGKLWDVYRAFMVKIPPIVSPKKTSWTSALARLPEAASTQVLADMAAARGKRMIAKYRREIAAQKLEDKLGLAEFSWAKILPIDGPPPPVELEKKKRRT